MYLLQQINNFHECWLKYFQICRNQTRPNLIFYMVLWNKIFKLRPNPVRVYSSLVLPRAIEFRSILVLSQNMYIVPLQWDTKWNPAHHYKKKNQPIKKPKQNTLPSPYPRNQTKKNPRPQNHSNI